MPMNRLEGRARGLTRPVLVALVCWLATGCGAPSPSQHIVRGESRPVIVTATPSPEAVRRPVALGAGTSVRRSWQNARVTAEFCGVAEAVRVVDGLATAPSTIFSEVTLFVGTPSYGTLDEPVGPVAAVPVGCNNGGGTGAGDLASAYMIVAERDGRLLSFAEITPKAHVGERAHKVFAVTFGDQAIEAHELWYRSEDATCCPSGRAATTWTYQDGTFTPSPAHITR
jgi:hypothetical protein